ncbi:hypothetical protein TNCV_4965521 [Trichonephila clavipes]|nr:hypothetical protein TNCV_4965521 [Trichonephila clavipes]
MQSDMSFTRSKKNGCPRARRQLSLRIKLVHSYLQASFDRRAAVINWKTRSRTKSDRSSQMTECDAFVLQEDNSRPQRAHIVDAYLEQEIMQRMQWPA